MFLVQVFMVTFSITWVYCSIGGINYMNPVLNSNQTFAKDDDPCNPLYWYPRNIPEFCYNKNIKQLLPPVPSMPLQMPFSVGYYPVPPMLPPPLSLPAPPYGIPAPSLPIPMYPPAMPLPFGVPIEPTYPMLPVAGVPALPYHNIFPPYMHSSLVGMVPGIPGMVTQDGGINILPFSDAYADMLENHKQKMLRKKLEKILADYDGYPGSKFSSRKHKRNKKYE